MKKYVLITGAMMLTLGIISESWAGRCDHPACTSCSSDGQWCNSCSVGYVLGPGECIACSNWYGSDCEECDLNICTSCKNGYVYYKGRCNPPIPNCLSYDWNGCTSCSKGVGKNCLICADDEIASNDTTCIKKNPLCTEYFLDNGITMGCKTCANDGYVPAPSPQFCMPCSQFYYEGCKTCSNGCTSCEDGYYYKADQYWKCVTECGEGYLIKDGNCISASDCGEGYQLKGNVCEKLPENCSEALGNTCSKCNTGYLEKGGDCISATQGCGVGYKDMGGFCNRIQYTPAEAAAILNDDNNSVTITFKK